MAWVGDKVLWHDTVTKEEYDKRTRNREREEVRVDDRSLDERRLARWDDGQYTGVERAA